VSRSDLTVDRRELTLAADSDVVDDVVSASLRFLFTAHTASLTSHVTRRRQPIIDHCSQCDVHETKCATSSKSEVQKRPGQGKENCHTISNKTAKPEREIVKKTTILQDMYRNTTSHISQLFIVKLRTFLQKDKYRKHTSSYFN